MREDWELKRGSKLKYKQWPRSSWNHNQTRFEGISTVYPSKILDSDLHLPEFTNFETAVKQYQNLITETRRPLQNKIYTISKYYFSLISTIPIIEGILT